MNAKANKSNTVTREQLEVGTAAAERLMSLVVKQQQGKDALASARQASKAQFESARTELNLSLKELFESGWRWNGTAKSNPVIQGFQEALASQKPKARDNIISTLKWCYTQRVQVQCLNVTMQQKKASQFDLLTGAEKEQPAAPEKSCAIHLIKAVDAECFEQVAVAFWKSIAGLTLPDKIDNPGEALSVALLNAAKAAKLIEEKDGKVVVLK